MLRVLSVCLAVVALGSASRLTAAEKPNVVFILADDLGYGDLGCYGQKRIQTPHLDALAAAGMRFTNCYAGSTVCAPSRCALMTGLHTGHCRTRGNGGGGSPRANVPLAPSDVCVAELFQRAGYATALMGKWGLGEEGSTGVPTKQGFDRFYGYLNQHHAHNYYPDYLIRGEAREPIPQNKQRADVENVAETPTVYAPDLIHAEAMKFVAENKDRPFFLYYSPTAPHANNEKTRFDKNGNEVPSDEPYSAESWPRPEKNLAAMITRLDRDVGALLKQLADLGIEKNTLVFFSSDNGPHKEGGNDPAFFRSSGPFRGIKRALTDGGIRVPMIVRWPGVVKPGSVSDHVWAFWDFLPTAAELVSVPAPAGLDGRSVLPVLTGKGTPTEHEFLYWEFHEGGFKQAVRHKHWKAIRQASGKPLELYDVVRDPGEATDVAAANPVVVQAIETYLTTARTESKEFPIRVKGKK